LHYLTAEAADDGSSELGKVRPITPRLVSDARGIAVAGLYFGEDALPPCGRAGKSVLTHRYLAPGQVRVHIVEHQRRPEGAPLPPDRGLHYSNAVDIVIILEGAGEMELGDGVHPLKVGDCITIPGVDHVFRPYPQGCRLAVFSIGMEIK